MTDRKLTRREALRLSALTITGAALAACGASPTQTPVVVEVTKVVEKPVTQVVTQIQTQVVEKQVTQVVQQVVTATPAPKAPVVLKFQSAWYVGSATDTLTAACKMFNDKYGPAVTVSIINLGTTSEDLLTSMAAGSANDVYHNYNFDATALFARGVVLPIDDLITGAKDFDRTIYTKDQWDGSSYNGKIYAMPCFEGIPAPALSWNKTLMTASGGDPSKTPQSWEEVVATAKTMNKFDAKGNLTQMGLDPLDANGAFLSTWCMVANADFINSDKTKFSFDNERYAKVLSIIAQLNADAGVPKVDAFKQQWDYWTGGAKSGFANGARVMILNGGWQPGELKTTQKDKTWQMAYDFFPTLDTGKKATGFGSTHQMIVPKISKYANEAFTFMSYMVGQDVTKLEFQIRGIACWNKYFAAMDTSSVPGLDWFLKSISVPGVTVWGPLRTNTPLGGEVQTLWTRAVGEAIYGTKTPTQALKDINAELQKDLDAFYAAQKK